MAFPADYTLLGKISTVTSQITGSHTGLPLVITEGSFNNGDDIRSTVFGNTDNGGGDVRLSTDAAGLAQLPLEVVLWDTAANACVIYTKRDVNGATAEDIYIWGDNTGDTQPTVTDTYGRNSVWSDFEYISHDGVTDSTGNHTITQLGSPTTATDIFGNVAGAVSLNGTTQYGRATGSFSSTKPIYISGWGNSNDVTSRQGLLGLYASGAGNNYVSLFNNTGSNSGFVERGGGGLTANIANSSGATTNNNWFAFDGVAITSSSRAAYLNGANKGTNVQTQSASNLNRITYGRFDDSTPNIYFNGELCQLRLGYFQPSDDYISTKYNNQNTPNTFFTSSSVSGAINVTGATPSYSYTAINATVDLTGEITVTGATPNYSYTTVNATVDLTGTISVTGATPSYSYTPVNANVLLQGAISVTGQTPSYSYTAVNANVQIGDIVLSTSFSGQFKESKFGNSLRESEFQGNYKESEFGDILKTSSFSGIIKESSFTGEQK